MTTEIKKEVPYRLNLKHPYLEEVHFAETDDLWYRGSWDKLTGSKFLNKMMEECVESTNEIPFIKTSKASYQLRNKNIYKIMSFLVKLKQEQKSLGYCNWYFWKWEHVDIYQSYIFFITGENQIESEHFSLDLNSDIDFDLLVSPYDGQEGEDKEYHEAVAHYWHRRFYKETQIGQIEAIREEMENERRKKELEKEAQSIAIENQEKMLSNLEDAKHCLHWILLLLIILAVLQFFR